MLPLAAVSVIALLSVCRLNDHDPPPTLQDGCCTATPFILQIKRFSSILEISEAAGQHLQRVDSFGLGEIRKYDQL